MTESVASKNFHKFLEKLNYEWAARSLGTVPTCFVNVTENETYVVNFAKEKLAPTLHFKNDAKVYSYWDDFEPMDFSNENRHIDLVNRIISDIC